jgi:hypothetical protein
MQYNTLFVVEVCLAGADQFILNCLEVKRKGTTFSLSQQHVGLKSVEELKPILKNKPPVVLLINGKGVLTRATDITEAPPRKLLHAVLPNASLDDFYVQSIPNGSGSFVSAVRRSAVESVRVTLAELTFVLDINVGPLLLGNLFPIIGQDNELTLSGYKLQFTEEKLAAFSRNDETGQAQIKLGDDLLDASLATCFGTAIEHFYHPMSSATHGAELAAQQAEMKQRNLFRVLAATVLTLLFAVLLGNFFLFDHYSNYHGELGSEMSLNATQVADVEALRSDLAIKRQLLASTGLLADQSIAWTFDQVVSTVPSEISLTALDGMPLVGKKNKRKQLVFDQTTVFVEGTVSHSDALNGWIKSLLELDHVSGVEIVTFSQPEYGLDGTFSLRLKL